MVSIILSMLVASLISHLVLRWLCPRLARLRAVLCSKALALSSLAFVCALSLALTGTRGAILMITATTLGLIPPLAGIRRIQLMGCLLVPIAITFLT
jgi:TctA family transporter